MVQPIQNENIHQRQTKSGQDKLPDQYILTEGPDYNVPTEKIRLKWYRSPLTREDLRELNKRSDFLGFVQAIGFLLVLTITSGLAIYASFNWPWYVIVLLVFINGHFWHFLVNGFHELVHNSVFKTQWLNRFFLRIYSFLGWHNHHLFWASHTEHHKYTLHAPDDQEVILPQQVDLKNIWKWGIINFRHPDSLIRNKLRNFTGYIDTNNSWVASLFPETDQDRRRAYTNWERILLIGHLLVAATSLIFGYWIIPLVFTFPRTFGSWLQFLCNMAQHIGLQDRVPDFRLCCRTIYLNPILQFLYWHMNYHTEHHMYAAVPCYKLGKLHRLIKHDMPYCPRGLIATWSHIIEILNHQKDDPNYQYIAELPVNTSKI